MKHVVVIFLYFLACQQVFAGNCDTIKIYFNTAEWVLNDNAFKELNVQLEQSFLKRGIPLSITGYADYIGEEAANKTLSQKRAETLAAWFVKNGWNRTDIKLVSGMGEVAEAGDTPTVGNPVNRRVDIVPYGKVDISWLPENIFFIPGLDTIRPDNRVKLDTLVKLMKTNPCLKISIEGHTCCFNHTKDGEKRLSTNSSYMANSISRGDFISKFLEKNGIEKHRLLWNPKGTGQPLYPKPANDEEHALNCRVAIRVVK